MTLKTIFVGSSDPSQAAVHVTYTPAIGFGTPATIKVVDVLELTEDRSKFAAVMIIDTAPIRPDFDKL